jgi:hypothetical protein
MIELGFDSDKNEYDIYNDQLLEPQDSDKNYLNRYVTAKPAEDRDNYAWNESLWYIASIVVIVAYIAIAAVAHIVAALYFPNYVPVVFVTAVGLTPQALNLYWMVYAYAQDNGTRKDTEAGVAYHLELLSVQAEESLKKDQELNKALNMTYLESQDITTLLPALARHEYYRDLSEKLLIKANNQFKQVQEWTLEHPTEQDKILAGRCKYVEFRDDHRKAKAWQAYMRVVLKHSDLRPDFQDICTVHTPPLGERVVAHIFGDKVDANAFLIGPRSEMVTEDKMDEMTIEKLTKRLERWALPPTEDNSIELEYLQ